MLGVIWDTMFLLAVSPVEWAMDCGRAEAMAAWKQAEHPSGPATGEAGDGAGRLAEDGAESAPDDEELAGNGSRPLSEEDREFLH